MIPQSHFLSGTAGFSSGKSPTARWKKQTPNPRTRLAHDVHDPASGATGDDPSARSRGSLGQGGLYKGIFSCT